MRPRPDMARPGPRLAGALLVAALCLSACEKVPGLDDPLPPDLEKADYPALVPLPPSLFDVTSPDDDASEVEADLSARASRLKSRANALRQQTPPD
ncbi:hypothetical protein [Chachezhania antarctica]|uniref:hypothetical protein n=1 Tax=Chachezhania antarctica TaxID=2340860 RepID=UPI000EB4D82D|nr:hypothetical protein [Chachezhania antarctica]